MTSFCYIMASQERGTLYIGVTSDLITRVHQHKSGTFKGFTSQYKVHNLVWFEHHMDIQEAIRREKQLKKWNRQWKIRLIQEHNPDWNDLYGSLVD